MTYDISDDKRRMKIFKTMLDHGDHAQYSVFFCELSNTDLVKLKSKLQSIIKPSEDQIIIIDLGKAEHDLAIRLEIVGQRYEPPSRVIVV